jgi:putative hydrolase of the HAD superfamily
MIGNSIKSDINPALAAGLHAVFLFHKDTWVLEHAGPKHPEPKHPPPWSPPTSRWS